MKVNIIPILISLLFCAASPGQNPYELHRRNGHLFLTAEICGERSEIMVESGIPALLLGQDFFERTLAGGNLTFEPSQARIRLLNNVYQIEYQSNGELEMGQARYLGPIFILKDFDGISLPVQNLYGESGRRMVTVDILNGRLSIGEIPEEPGRCYQLHLDKKTGFPIVKAGMAISSQGKKAVLRGDLIVDFGNPMLVFLMSRHKSVGRAMKKGKIIAREARNERGEIVAQGIYADSITICGQEYNDVSLGLTGKMTAIKEMGFLGLPFFNSAVTLDFDNGKMFVR